MPLLRINRTPPPLQLRVFATAFGVAAGFVAFKLDRHGLDGGAWITALAGVTAFVIGMAAPRALRWLYLGLSYATYPVGFVLSYAVLAVLFYLVIMPIGLAFRAFGYDPLKRKSSKVASFWDTRAPAPDPKRYLQQS